MPLPTRDRRRQSRRHDHRRRAGLQDHARAAVQRDRREGVRRQRHRRPATSARAAHNVAFVVPNIDLAPAGAGHDPAAAPLLRAAAERDDDRPVRERLRVDLQRDAAGVPAPASQRPDDQLQLHARAHEWTQPTPKDVERHRALRRRLRRPPSLRLLGQLRAAVRPVAHRRRAGRCSAGWQINGVAYWQSGLPFNVTNSHGARQHRRRQRSAEPGRRSELDNPTVAQWFNIAAFARAADQHDRQRAAQRPARAAAAPPRPVAVQGLHAGRRAPGCSCGSRSTTSPTRRASPTRTRALGAPASASITSIGNRFRGRCSSR